MDNAVAVSLASYFENNSDKKKLLPGKYPVDSIVKIHIKGEITKCKDESFIPTVKIPLIPTLILCLKKAGIQRENIINSLVSAMTEALVNEETPEILETMKDIKVAERMVYDALDKLPPATRSGKTLVNVSIEEI